MLIRFLLILAVAVFGAVKVHAAATINVSIDTTSIVGQNGGIYFQFDPGLNADAASVSIANFQISALGALDPVSPLNFFDGGVSGSLDADSLFLTNSHALNDYGEALTFGQTINFTVILSYPPVLVGQSGSELDIQVTAADLLTPLLTADPNGNLVRISYDQTGALNASSTSPAAGVSQVAATPEPGTFNLLAVFVTYTLLRRRKS